MADDLSLPEIIQSRKQALTVKEFADLLHVGKVTVYDWINSGRLPAIKVGSLTRLDPKTTAAWLRGRLTVDK